MRKEERNPVGDARQDVRIMLCEQRPRSARSLLLDIVQTQVLEERNGLHFRVVSPLEDLVVRLEDLDRALAATPVDILLVLADTVGLSRARSAAQRYAGVEVVAVTRAGYVLVDLAPANLVAVLWTLGEAQRARRVADAGPRRVRA